MAAYVIAYLEVTDPKAFEVYRRAAGPTFGPYGGRPLVVDGPFEVLEGMMHPKSVVGSGHRVDVRTGSEVSKIPIGIGRIAAA